MSTKKKMSVAGVALAVAVAPIMGVGTAAFATDDVVPVEVVEATSDVAALDAVEDVVVEDTTPVVEEVPVVEEEPVLPEEPVVPEVPETPGEGGEVDPELPTTIPGEDGNEDGETPGEAETDEDPVALTAPGASATVTGPNSATLSGFSHDPVDKNWGLFTHYTVNVNGVGYETDGGAIELTGLEPDTEYTAEVFYGTTFGETSPTTTVTFRTEGEELTAPYVSVVDIQKTSVEVRTTLNAWENWHGAVVKTVIVVHEHSTGISYTYEFNGDAGLYLNSLVAGTEYTIDVTQTTANGFTSPTGSTSFKTLGESDNGGETGGENGGENGENGGENGGNTGGENGGNTGGENGGNNGNSNNTGNNGNTGGNNTGGKGNVTLDGTFNGTTDGVVKNLVNDAPAAENTTPALATTGSESNMLGAFGAALAALGLGAVAFGRRVVKRNAA